jgi:hypothetical protein
MQCAWAASVSSDNQTAGRRALEQAVPDPSTTQTAAMPLDTKEKRAFASLIVPPGALQESQVPNRAPPAVPHTRTHALTLPCLTTIVPTSIPLDAHVPPWTGFACSRSDCAIHDSGTTRLHPGLWRLRTISIHLRYDLGAIERSWLARRCACIDLLCLLCLCQ